MTAKNNLRQKHYQLEKEYAKRILALPKGSIERKKMLTEGYDNIINLINSYNPRGFASNHSRFYFNLIKKRINKNTKILDFGCGDGLIVYLFNQAGYEAEGFDICAPLIESAKKRLKVLDKENAVWQGDIFSARGSYDLILMDNVIEHFTPDEAEDILKACYSLLNPGGSIWIITPHLFNGPHDISRHFVPLGEKAQGFHFKEYKIEELAESLRAGGFKSLYSYFIYPNPFRYFSFILKPRKVYIKRSIFFEKIFSKKYFKPILKINKVLSKILVYLFFPPIIIAKK